MSDPERSLFVPSGIVTLMTDFGRQDVFVGTMKGQMLRRFAGVRIVDLSHEILAHWPDEAGFWLARSHRYFPPGTVHVAVVDPGVGTDRDIVAAELDQQLFLAPDNGLLGSLVRQREALIRRVDPRRFERFGIARPSFTFHGRDVFAPLAAELAAGRVAPGDLGPVATEIVPRWLDEPRVDNGTVSGLVLTVDHFGNLITNIDAALVAAIRQPVVHAGGRQLPLRKTYGDARPGDYLALINSFDVLEIACAQRSAADGLGLGRGAPVSVRPLD